MAGLLDAIFGQDTETIDRVRSNTGDDRKKAEQAYGAAAGTILRGIEKKSQTKEGAESIWDVIRKAVEQGKLPTGGAGQGGAQVRELDSQTANDLMKAIFGKNAPDVQGGLAKVTSLDPEQTNQVFAKVLPAVLGNIFGEAERDPDDSPKAMPKIVAGARSEMDKRQPKAAGIFDAILDRDNDGEVDLEDISAIFSRKPR